MWEVVYLDFSMQGKSAKLNKHPEKKTGHKENNFHKECIKTQDYSAKFLDSNSQEQFTLFKITHRDAFGGGFKIHEE